MSKNGNFCHSWKCAYFLNMSFFQAAKKESEIIVEWILANLNMISPGYGVGFLSLLFVLL